MMSETQHFENGKVIMTQGDESDNHAYLIEQGSLDVLRHGEKIDSLHTGDIFGEIALVVDEKRSATIIANGSTEVIVFNKDEFIMLCKKS
jgi:cAMP-dependent protein kinase regulator